MEACMRRFVSLIISMSILLSLTGCSKKPRLDLESFEKYALADLKLEKKDISTQESNAYYDLDYTITNDDASTMKRDHYIQVFSKSTSTVGNLYMVYTDYQLEDDARNYFTDLVAQEKEMLSTTSDKHTIDEGSDYLIVLTQPDELSYRFECLYIQKDVILFAAVILAASDVSRMDAEWLKNVRDFFDDLHVRQPLTLSPEISAILKK